MAPGYKDHPIPDLLGEPTGDDGIYLRPMQVVYEKWMANVSKHSKVPRTFWGLSKQLIKGINPLLLGS
eukprot:2448297-Rhodomonas_salina.1